jgi:hypothetical protein
VFEPGIPILHTIIKDVLCVVPQAIDRAGQAQEIYRRFCRMLHGHLLPDVKGIKGIRYGVLDFTAEAMGGEKSRSRWSSRQGCESRGV